MRLPPDSVLLPYSEQAVVGVGRGQHGRPCRVVDDTDTMDLGLPEALLANPVQAWRFALSGMSASGPHALRLGAPELTHIPLGGEGHRLNLFPYEARQETFST
jgi:hypothetical protein